MPADAIAGNRTTTGTDRESETGWTGFRGFLRATHHRRAAAWCGRSKRAPATGIRLARCRPGASGQSGPVLPCIGLPGWPRKCGREYASRPGESHRPVLRCLQGAGSCPAFAPRKSESSLLPPFGWRRCNSPATGGTSRTMDGFRSGIASRNCRSTCTRSVLRTERRGFSGIIG